MLLNKKIAGLEINPTHIRVVELTAGSPKPGLVNLGSVDLPQGAVMDGSIKEPDVVSNAIKKLWRETGIKTKDVLLGLNNQYVVVRVTNMPKSDPDQRDKTIRYQAQEYLPVPVNSVELDYLVIDDDIPGQPNQMKVMLVAGGKHMILEHIAVIRKAGLRVMDIDVSALALTKILTLEQKSGTSIFINFCRDISVLLIISNGRPVLVRNMSVKLSKYQMSDTGELLDDDLPSLVESVSGDIISSVNYYNDTYPGAYVGSIYMTGMLCQNQKFKQTMNDDLGIHLVSINPFEMLADNPEKTGNIANPGEYGIPVGLAIRGLEGAR